MKVVVYYDMRFQHAYPGFMKFWLIWMEVENWFMQER